MDLFVNLHKSSIFFNYNLLPQYTYYDLYIRSLNMAHRFKQDKHQYILLFMPNCIEYIECIFASIMANVSTLHCSYENILKHILLPEIDLIITTKTNLHLINTLLNSCNEKIANEIRSKMIIVNGHLTGKGISTVPMLSDRDIMGIYRNFIHNSTKYFIFTSNSNMRSPSISSVSTKHTKLPHQFLKASVQYIQYHSYYYKNRYRKNATFTLFPYSLNTLNGIICLFNIINNWECIIDLDAKFRYGEEYFENYLLPFNNITVNDTKGLVDLYISEEELNKYDMFYNKRSNTIRMTLSKDFYTTDYISDAQSKELVIHNGLSGTNPYSYITIFDNSVEEIIDSSNNDFDFEKPYTIISKKRYKISKKYINNYQSHTIISNSTFRKSATSKSKKNLNILKSESSLDFEPDFEMATSKFEDMVKVTEDVLEKSQNSQEIEDGFRNDFELDFENDLDNELDKVVEDVLEKALNSQDIVDKSSDKFRNGISKSSSKSESKEIPDRIEFENLDKVRNRNHHFEKTIEVSNNLTNISKKRYKEVRNTYKSIYLTNHYKIHLETLPFRLNISHFYSLSSNIRTNGDCGLLLQLDYIPIKGINLIDMSNKLTLCSENILYLWLLSDRKTLVYIYSHFSKKIHDKVHQVILNDIYKINNIDIKDIDSKELVREVNWDKFKKRQELFSKYSTWKSLFPMTFWEVLYLILYMSQFSFTQIYDKVRGLINREIGGKMRIQDYDRHDQIYYNVKPNVVVLSKEQTNKLRLYCRKERIEISDLIQLLCVAIIQKCDPSVNVYCKRLIDLDEPEIGGDYVHVKHLGPVSMISPNMERIFMTYVRLFSRLRFCILRKISENCMLPKNRIYVNCDGLLWGEPLEVHEGPISNTVGMIQFYIGDGQLMCNLLGIKIKGYYLVLSAMIQSLKQYFDVLLV
jgi:hypothetical protein